MHVNEKLARRVIKHLRWEISKPNNHSVQLFRVIAR